MDILVVMPRQRQTPSFSSNLLSSNSSSNSSSSPFRNSFTTFCSKKGDNGSNDDSKDKDNDNKGDNLSIDWDKAWSSFKRRGKKSFFSQFSPNKYVSWNPRRSDYPLSEEVDPIKRTEKSNLMLWTSPGFTLVGAIVIVSFLLIYTILAPIK